MAPENNNDPKPTNDASPEVIKPSAEAQVSQQSPAEVGPAGMPESAVPVPSASPANPSVDSALGSTPSSTPNTAEPATSSTPVVGGAVVSPDVDSSPQPNTAPPASKRRFSFNFKKRGLLALVAALVVVGLSAAYVFGYYIPNKPENVWAKAVSNNGKVYDTLTGYVTEQKVEDKAYKFDGSYKLTGQVTSDGSFSGVASSEQGQMSGYVSTQGIKVGFDFRAVKSKTSTPDLYLKVSGLEGLTGLLGGSSSPYASIFDKLNNQWYFIDHSLFDQLSSASIATTKYSDEDLKNFFKAAGEPSKQYLFSTESSKQVLVVKDVVGTETKDGRSSIHYKVGYDLDHLKAYTKALCTSLKSDKIGKDLLKSYSSCDEFAKQSVGDSKQSNDTADVWVDKHTKLMHVVRFTDKDKSYVELAQDYQGGDEVPFSLKGQSAGADKVDGAFKGTMNMKTGALEATGTFTASGSASESGTFKFNMVPTDKSAVKVDKPAKAKTFMELLNSLGLDGLVSEGGASSF